MTPNKLTLKIERPAYGNVYIAKLEGKVVMVSGQTMPGETVEVTVDKDRKDYITATVSRIIEPSPDRVKPECEYFGICGGCHLQHIPYEQQIKMKEDILSNCLKRIAKTEIDLSESLVGNSPWKYRIRGQFKVEGDDSGFYKENTRDVVNIDKCLIMTDDLNKHFQKARELVKMHGIKELHITSGDRPVALLKVSREFPHNVDLNSLVSKFTDAGFPGLSIDTGETMALNFGDPYLSLDLDGLKYSISPMSFLQSNWDVNIAMIRLIKKELQLTGKEKILDLYAGAGNFSLPLAEGCEVTGIEENPYAIDDGMRNLELNNITRYRFVKSRAEEFQAEQRPGILILDPPRLGLSNKVTDNVLQMLPEKILYISCNPTTFARDIKKLLTRYEFNSVRMVDLFPQTFHIETMAFLSLK
ncbi:MAG: class I SAM-dependent RNA methyltransferase [Nitrospirae bacterium]|nr:class I SAM-dependent RNA methyltransferase [Nitrospirota bacterium]